MPEEEKLSAGRDLFPPTQQARPHFHCSEYMVGHLKVTWGSGQPSHGASHRTPKMCARARARREAAHPNQRRQKGVRRSKLRQILRWANRVHRWKLTVCTHYIRRKKKHNPLRMATRESASYKTGPFFFFCLTGRLRSLPRSCPSKLMQGTTRGRSVCQLASCLSVAQRQHPHTPGRKR